MDPAKPHIARALLPARRAAADGITAQTAQIQDKYWKEWAKYCRSCGQADPFLENVKPLQQTLLLMSFAARARTGAFGRKHQVRVQSVTDALAAITQTFKLAGKQSPVIETTGEYILPVRRVIEGFQRQDPLSIPQVAVPVDVVNQAQKSARPP